MTIKRRPSFDPKSFLAEANAGRHIVEYRKDQIVFSQGESADAVFYIQKGQVKVTVISEQGKEAIVALLGPDEFLGEGCLNGQRKRLATATAMTECAIMRVGRAEMLRVLRDEPAFSEMFISHILTRNARVEEDLVDQLFNSTEKRLARLLLLLANFGKEGRPEPVIAKISQETLAEMIGTTRSRVSHFMNKFRQLGFNRLQWSSRSAQFVIECGAERAVALGDARRRLRHIARIATHRYRLIGRVEYDLSRSVLRTIHSGWFRVQNCSASPPEDAHPYPKGDESPVGSCRHVKIITGLTKSSCS